MGCFSKWDIGGCGCGCECDWPAADFHVAWGYDPDGTHTASGTATMSYQGVVAGLQTWQTTCLTTGLSGPSDFGVSMVRSLGIEITFDPASCHTVLTVTGYQFSTSCTGNNSVWKYDSSAPFANQIDLVSCTKSPMNWHFVDSTTEPDFWDLTFTP